MIDPELEDRRNKVLRMIIRCGKVRKHKPKSVKEPKLVIGGDDSPSFSKDLERKYYKASETRQLKESLRNIASQD